MTGFIGPVAAKRLLEIRSCRLTPLSVGAGPRLIVGSTSSRVVCYRPFVTDFRGYPKMPPLSGTGRLWHFRQR